MKRGLIIGILIISLILISGIAGCIQQPIKKDNFNELMNLLNTKQNIENYNVTYSKVGSYSMETYRIDAYNIEISDESVINGTGLTALDIKNKVKNLISNWDQSQKDELINLSLDNTQCFNKDNEVTICFDNSNNLVYYAIYGYDRFTWEIPSLFNYSDEFIQNKLYVVKMAKVAESKIKECSDEACKKFFTLLNKPSENEYEIKEEYEIKPYDYYTSDYRYVLNYKIKDKEIESVERLEGVYGTPISEDMLKTQLFELQSSCNFKYTQDEWACFEFEINAGTCELQSNYNRNTCTYCFSSEGYLMSGSCLGNGHWNWTKK